MPGLDQLLHFPVEKGQEKRGDVRTVHVGIGHDDDPVVTEFADVEIVFPDSAADSSDKRLNLFIFQHLVNSGLFHVQEFPSNRDDRLELAVSALFGGTSGGIAFDNVNFTFFRFLRRTGSKFTSSVYIVNLF